MKIDKIPEIDADLKNDALSVIWERCFERRLCINIPLDGRRCVKARGCVRIILEKGKYYIEIQLFGTKKRFDLATKCITGFTVGIASLKVCVSVTTERGQIKGVRIDVRLCIGAFGLEKCWDVIGADINFFYVADASSYRRDALDYPLLAEMLQAANAAGGEVFYIESDDEGDAERNCCVCLPSGND